MSSFEDHISFAIFSVIFGAISGYFFISMLIYLIKTKESKSLSSKERKYSYLSLVACLLVSLFSLFRNATSGGGHLWIKLSAETNTTVLFLEKSNIKDFQSICDVSVGLVNFVFIIAKSFVYLFLWVTQRIVYIHPFFRTLNNKFIRIASYAVFVVGLFHVFFTTIAYYIFVRFDFDIKNIICTYLDFMSRVWFLKIILSWSVVSFVIQLTLLALFIYPLIPQELWRRKENFGKSKLFFRAKKAIILASLSLLTDSLVLIFAFTSKTSISVLTILFNINLFVNNVAIVFSFDNWKKIICPCTLEIVKKLFLTKNVPYSSLNDYPGNSDRNVNTIRL